jgi:hypothetical protein
MFDSIQQKKVVQDFTTEIVPDIIQAVVQAIAQGVTEKILEQAETMRVRYTRTVPLEDFAIFMVYV